MSKFVSLKERPPYILFADDNQDMIELVKLNIEIRKWNADYVNTAHEIIEKVNEKCNGVSLCYDCIVADINFFSEHNNYPRLTGMTAVAEIRKAHINVPIIFVSAYLSMLNREEATKLGALAIDKPVNFEKLFLKIEQLVIWNRQASANLDVTGDRRRNSVNKTNHRRRLTDGEIEIPSVLQNVINEVREEKLQRQVGNGN